MILYEKGSTTAEASGTTFTLQDTSNERKLSFKKYYGNTTQETTSGKNKIGLTDGTYSHNSITAVVSNGTITLSGTANGISLIDIPLLTTIPSSLGTITKSLNPTGTYTNVQTSLRASNGETSVGLWSNNGANKSETLSGDAYIFRIQVNNGVSVNCTLKPQVEIGSSATSWEKFTYGATPNPYYPQPINVVTGGNTISVVGKNLFDIQQVTTSNTTNWTLTKTINTLTIKHNNSYSTGAPILELRNLESGDYIFSYETSITGRKLSLYINGTYSRLIASGDVITLDNTKSYSIRFGVGDNETVTFTNIQLEKGNQATTYEDYIGRNYEINLGKNLLSGFREIQSNASYEDGVLTISSLSNSRCKTNYIKATGLTYYFNYDSSTNVRWYVEEFDASYNQLRSNSKTSPQAFTLGSDAVYFDIVFNLASGTTTPLTISKMQVEIGNLATPYSPYKTPIELNKIGTYQDTIFKSSGINLVPTNVFDKPWTVSGSGDERTLISYSSYKNRAYVVQVEPNTTYTISGDFSVLQNNTMRIAMFDNEPDVGSTSTKYVYGTSPYVFTTDTNTNYIVLLNSNNEDTTVNLLMLLKGTYTSSTIPPYEPYGKDWYIKKEIGKVVLDGVNYTISGFGYNNRGTITISDAKPTTYSTQLSLCSHFTFDSSVYSDSQDNVGYCSRNNSGGIFVRFGSSSEINTQTKANNWLATNKPILYYQLNTPTYTKITDEELLGQIEALENATTYDNVTNILQYNANLPLYVDIEYLKPLDFSRNGLGYLPNVLNAYVTDEINGEYSLTFEYPIEDRMASEIVEDRIVKCKVADGSNQCFIIKKIQKNFDKMNVYCTHLFYMLYDDFLEDTYPQNLSPKPFLDHILSRANYQLPFVANSDIATTKTARYVRKNVVETILGNINNSMYNLWGLELKRDNWNIGLKARLGSNKGEKLIFGKNITGVDVSVDTTGIYTRIMPIGFDGLLLPEKYIDAPNINEYPYPRICLYEFSNIRYDANEEDTEAYHTLDEAYQALRNATQELFDKGINKPKINIKVDWLELSKTEEFKQYSALERVDLGDTLTSNLFGMDYETRVIKTIYNPLNDRIEQFEIGTFKPSITTEMNQLNFDVVNLPSSMLDEAQANATQLITQAMGGYVYKTNSELYIMDTNDPATAQNVWRWNINGLGYSSTGINGPYGLAMTMDGAIVADFITAGQIDTNVINGYDSLTTQVYANTNNLDNVNSDLQQYKSQVSTQFVQTANDFSFQFNNINQLINDVSNTTSDSFNEINKYIRFVNGVIVLGEEGNEMTAELSNDKLSFKQNGTEIAYVSNNKLYITNAEMLYNLVIGNFQFIPRNNGSLSFRRVG